MTTIAQIRDNLNTCVSTITGLVAYSYIQDTITPPCAHIVPMEYDPREVFSSAKVVYPFQIRVYAPRAAAESSQTLLDTYREPSGATSIIAAVQNSANWTVTVDFAQVTRVGEVQAGIDIAGTQYLYLEIDVEVQI